MADVDVTDSETVAVSDVLNGGTFAKAAVDLIGVREVAYRFAVGDTPFRNPTAVRVVNPFNWVQLEVD